MVRENFRAELISTRSNAFFCASHGLRALCYDWSWMSVWLLIGWFKFNDLLLTADALSTEQDKTEHFTIYLTYSPVGSIFFPTPTGQNQGTGPFTKVLVDTQSQLPAFKLLSASNWNSSKTCNITRNTLICWCDVVNVIATVGYKAG